MDLQNLYVQVKSYIDTIDFSKLWNGFAPLKFALYTADACYFDGAYMPKTDEFIANTSILFEGEWIAIWNVQEEMDPIVLASKMVHEMFHGFQQMHGECRFPDELDALYHSQYDAEYLSLKLQENHLLRDLSKQFDADTFRELLQIRKYRSVRFPYAYHYESCVEQIEGCANFVELQCLKQLSAELFEKKRSAIQERITDPANLLPIRVICYDIGALLLSVMADNRIAFDRGFSPIPFAQAMLDGIEGTAHAPAYDVQDLLDAYQSRAKATIAAAIRKNDLVTDKACDLLGVNVYNAVYCDGHIISNYFVMFGSPDAPRVEYGNFVIETPAYKKVAKIYRV